MTTSIKRLCAIVVITVNMGMLPACTKKIADQATIDTQRHQETFIPQRPFPVQIRYPVTQTIPNHISSRQQISLIRSVYDRWKSNYLSSETYPLNQQKNYRITAGKKKARLTFSEGQGYGMILTAYMAGHDPDAQIIFNGLYRFAREHPSRIEQRFMAYQVPVVYNRRNSAFDGDADIAFALLLADEQWGSEGAVDYRKEAVEIIDTLANKVIGRDSHLPMLGDWVRQNGKKYNQHTVRSSDIMPAHFKVFREASGNSLWEKITQQSQATIDLLQGDSNNKSKLVPDFIISSTDGIVKPAPAHFLESKYDGAYYYNAARVPWRLAEDALLLADPASIGQLQKMARWIIDSSGNDPANIGPGYHLDGSRLDNSDHMSMAFIGPFGLAVMTLQDQHNFVNRIFDLCTTVQQDYYEDTISLFSLLLMSGNYWLPKPQPLFTGPGESGTD